jgi:twinkle protein
MDIDALLDPKKAADKVLGTEPTRNYAAGIANPAAVGAAMSHGFRHGKQKGSPTHWPEFGDHFSWKPGELSVWTGYNNAGKSETVLQLMLLKSIRDGWKWAVFSPENEPVTEIFDQLAHAMAGKSPDPSWSNQMPEAVYERAKDFLFKHFFVISPPEIWTVDCLLDYFRHLIETEKVNGCLLDPWNQLVHDIGAAGREDLYLSTELSKIKRFAQKHKQSLNITAHPTKPPLTAGEKWRCPDQFSLAGGAMWGNKADNVLAVHRPNYRENKADTLVEWHAHKIKKQKLVGRPGFVTLDFDYGRNRYTVNGASPLEPWASRIVAPEAAGYNQQQLPASNFDPDYQPIGRRL